jgi:hypothetical protein
MAWVLPTSQPSPVSDGDNSVSSRFARRRCRGLDHDTGGGPSPAREEKGHLALGKTGGERRTLTHHHSLGIIVEQVSRYGYCRLQGTQNGNLGPSPQP